MSSWAKPGVKCVCITTRRSYHPLGWNVAVGQTYTIRSVEVSDRGEVCIALVEFKNWFGKGPIWPIWAFRPLVTRDQEQDVALFRHHLAKAPEPVA